MLKNFIAAGSMLAICSPALAGALSEPVVEPVVVVEEEQNWTPVLGLLALAAIAAVAASSDDDSTSSTSTN